MNDSIINISANNLNNSSLVTNGLYSFVNNSITNYTQNATASILKIDPNWFYSSAAQSAAAIVGLMGALIVTKLINEKSFFKQLQREINEYELKIQSTTEEIETKKDWLDKADLEIETKLVEEFLDSQVSVIDLDVPPNIDELYNVAIKEEDYKNINKGILEKKYNTEYLENVEKYRQSEVPGFLRGLIKLPIKTYSFGLLEYRHYKDEINKQQAELSFYEIILRDKKTHLKSNDDVLNLRWYILSLLIFSILGIFFPLYVMLLDYDRMMELRFETFLGISIGWLFIIGYFFLEVRNTLKISK